MKEIELKEVKAEKVSELTEADGSVREHVTVDEAFERVGGFGTF